MVQIKFEDLEVKISGHSHGRLWNKRLIKQRKVKNSTFQIKFFRHFS